MVSSPGGALWGANAVNGVINIITRSAADTQGVLAYAQRGSLDQCMTGEAPAQAETPQGEESRGAGAILMVEDDDTLGAMIGEMLSELGYEVVRVASAQEASVRLADGAASVDILFSDIVMPGDMSGIDLACDVQRQPRFAHAAHHRLWRSRRTGNA